MTDSGVSGEAPSSSDIGMYGASKAALNRLTVSFAQSLVGTGVRVNTVAPRGAVLSEGMQALMGDTIRDDLVESMEAMVEGVIALCDCDEKSTGRVLYSLGLLEELGTQVMTLDGRQPYPGGFRVFRGKPQPGP
jgi:citronellol/citronellal dehydrogenase